MGIINSNGAIDSISPLTLVSAYVQMYCLRLGAIKRRLELL